MAATPSPLREPSPEPRSLSCAPGEPECLTAQDCVWVSSDVCGCPVPGQALSRCHPTLVHQRNAGAPRCYADIEAWHAEHCPQAKSQPREIRPVACRDGRCVEDAR